MEELLVIKIGGNIIDNESALNQFLQDFANIKAHKILVHGGGKIATDLSNQLGIETKMVEGRRVTDEQTIRVVTMTYAGWINKSITALLQSKKCNVIGLSGADAKLFPAIKRPVVEWDYGLVGDLLGEHVNTQFLNQLLVSGIVPVIAPITCDDNGHLLNVNADTVARTLAEALSKMYRTTLIYCFEKNGLLRDVNDGLSVIHEIDRISAERLKESGVINKGMIPKIDNALGAIGNGVNSVIIGHATHILKMAQKEKGYGTYVRA